jgi:hypothetical protein
MRKGYESCGKAAMSRAAWFIVAYVVETERGQETLTPAEMAKKYGWHNDPAKVRLAH